MYFLFSAALPRLTLRVKAVTIFVLAAVVELFQATGIPGYPGMPRIIKFLVGTTFDPTDFVFYLLGVILSVAIDWKFARKESEDTEKKSRQND